MLKAHTMTRRAFIRWMLCCSHNWNCVSNIIDRTDAWQCILYFRVLRFSWLCHIYFSFMSSTFCFFFLLPFFVPSTTFHINLFVQWFCICDGLFPWHQQFGCIFVVSVLSDISIIFIIGQLTAVAHSPISYLYTLNWLCALNVVYLYARLLLRFSFFPPFICCSPFPSIWFSSWKAQACNTHALCL